MTGPPGADGHRGGLPPPDGAPTPEGRGRPLLRWALPSGLLLVEYLSLSVLVDLPTTGPAMRLVQAMRLAVPVALGAVAAGWLLARAGGAGGRGEAGSLAIPEPWRPWPWLALQPAAFACVLAFAPRVLGGDAASPGPGSILTLAALFAASVLLALFAAAPPRFFAEALLHNWRYPLLALASGALSWRAATAAEDLWGVLSAGTLRATSFLLRLGPGEPMVDTEGSILGLDGFEVHIAAVCSGADGTGLVVLFQALWISLVRDRLRLPRALVLLPIGVAAALLANVLRIAALVWLGAAGHETLATGGFHSKLGWILFMGIAIGTVAAGDRVAWLQAPGAREASRSPGLPASAASYVAPLLAALAVSVVTGVLGDGRFDRWYAARILAACAVLYLVRASLPRPSYSWSWVPILGGALVCLAWVPLGGGSAPPPEALLHLSAHERAAWIAARLVGSCLVIPVVEELAFRGFLLRWLVSPDFDEVPPRTFTWTAVMVSSLVFGTMHASWALGAVAGLAFAAVFVWRGRLSDAVVAHAVANAGVAAAVLGGGQWGLWTS